MPTRCLCLLAAAVLVAPAAGQSGPTLATVAADDVTVRGSPRADGPDTGTLARGTPVVVHHEEGDKWLAIQPPRGSVSWVNHLFVRIDKQVSGTFFFNAVVEVEAGGQVRLAVGKAGVDHPLDVRLAAIPGGTILRVIGPKVTSPDDNSTWYPIEPPEDDFRYIPKDAVTPSGPVKASFVVKSPPEKPRLTVEAMPAALPNPVAGKPAGWPSNPLWAKAEAAMQAGDTDAAERLYFQLARDMNAPGGDEELANLCYSRIHAIRGKQSAAGTPAPAAPAPARRPDARDDGTREGGTRESAAAPARAEWTGAGTLRKATFKVNGKQAYALEGARTKVLMYAIPGADVDLDRYLRRDVDLCGTVQMIPDLRGVGLMTVMKVDPIK